ncbi:hypothetical protein TNCV_2131421 [Trichonephila clavipes]|nr:hypothetical protein TNCV_2131421 [Trichonephila clavipes]
MIGVSLAISASESLFIGSDKTISSNSAAKTVIKSILIVKILKHPPCCGVGGDKKGIFCPIQDSHDRIKEIAHFAGPIRYFLLIEQHRVVFDEGALWRNVEDSSFGCAHIREDPRLVLSRLVMRPLLLSTLTSKHHRVTRMTPEIVTSLRTTSCLREPLASTNLSYISDKYDWRDYRTAFGDGPRHLGPWSSDVDDIDLEPPSPNYHTNGGVLSLESFCVYLSPLHCGFEHHASYYLPYKSEMINDEDGTRAYIPLSKLLHHTKTRVSE